jgi:predicted chitinase
VVGNFGNIATLVCKKCSATITLTKEFLNRIAPDANNAFIDELIKCSVELFPKYGINTCRQIKHILAQAKHETKLFRAFREGLNYTRVTYTAETLYALSPTAINNGFIRKGITFPNHTAKIQWIDQHLLGNDSALGEHSYGTSEQPGKDFRGRGLLHLTHYETYKKCAKETGYPINSQPELVENNPRVIVETGLWFWKDRNIAAIADDPGTFGDEGVRKVTRPINSGLDGIARRQQYFREITTLFNQIFHSGCIND